MKYQDEISVADVLYIIIKRLRWAVASFFLPIFAMIIILTVSTEKTEYQSIYQLAEKSTGEALERPSLVIEKLKRIYYPQAQFELANEGVMQIGEISTELASPRDTLLITIVSQASEQQSEKVRLLHEHMINAINESQRELFERFERRVRARLESAQESLGALRSEEANYSGELAAQYVDQISKYEDRLLSLQNGRLILLNSKSADEKSMNSIFLLLVSVVMGIVLAISVPLVIEGLHRVLRIIRSVKG